tara:strand:+ start:1097 stop:1819 length:723 start_codon:yes stop_codon:yes gene_type:complete
MTKQASKLVLITDLGPKVTLADIANPMVNVEHSVRVPFFKDKREQGTTIPLILFAALKVKALVSMGKSEEVEDLDSKTIARIRDLLNDIHGLKVSVLSEEDAENVLVAKTVQEVVFNHLVYGGSLAVRSVDDLLFEDSQNKAHTISGNGSPSFSLPPYLCRYRLKEERLNVKSPFNAINPLMKAIAKEVFSGLKNHDKDDWAPLGSFSRRVHNYITYEALCRHGFSQDELKTKINNPGLD